MSQPTPTPAPAPQPLAPGLRLVLVGLLLAALTLAAYGRVCSADFVILDDDLYVRRNNYVLGGLTGRDVAWAWTTFHAGNWHPLTWLSLQLDAQFYGASAPGYHLTNLL